jgi:hypothetical protein
MCFQRCQIFNRGWKRKRPLSAAHHLAALHVRALDAAQQQPHVLPRLPLVQQLLEHLHPGHRGGDLAIAHAAGAFVPSVWRWMNVLQGTWGA